MFSLKQGNLAQAKYAEKIHSETLAWARCSSPERLFKKRGSALGLIFAQARTDFRSSEGILAQAKKSLEVEYSLCYFRSSEGDSHSR